ncbi:hypothetical protein [Pseudogulbenkiania sp. MAI-1]|uniref:COG4648 family protein n=1 Tax=Pseudogulbenkiania sp. MAI-1 TaxID=990370 RepID=UPI00045E9AD7|nr:hypothetical protein [Pseudogulbenkiania sp. MAI-1]
MKRLLALLGALAYPLAVFLALKYFEPRLVGASLLLVLLLRYRRQSRALWQGFAGVQRLRLLGLIALSAAVTLSGSAMLLRLMPALISLSMLLVFGHTLIHPPSMIERFARQITPDLPPAGVAYTRNVTRVWCGFFVLNAAVAGYTALPAGQAYWLLYNGLLSYLAMGALFAGEWLYRRWRHPESRP